MATTTLRMRLNTPKKVWTVLDVFCFHAHLRVAVGFSTSTIVKVVASAGVIAAFYKYAPSSSDDNIITRYISSNATPSEVWEKVNIKHAILEQQQADDSQILWSAQKPPVHRYRYPQCVRLSLCSPGPMLIRTLVDKSTRLSHTDSQLVPG
jgi:hypothetical protein